MYVGLCEMQVKVVRDLMNQMIDAWKQVSESSFVENSLVDDSRSPPKGTELVLIVLCIMYVVILIFIFKNGNFHYYYEWSFLCSGKYSDHWSLTYTDGYNYM